MTRESPFCKRDEIADSPTHLSRAFLARCRFIFSGKNDELTPDYLNDANDPVNGGVITFTAPTSGASARLSAASATIAGGSASVAATANGTSGAYTVTATASGVASGASFSLANVSLVVNNPTDTPVFGETDLRQAIAN